MERETTVDKVVELQFPLEDATRKVAELTVDIDLTREGLAELQVATTVSRAPATVEAVALRTPSLFSRIAVGCPASRMMIS